MKVLLIAPLNDDMNADRSKRSLMEERDKLGILYIASYLEQYNIEVSVLDMSVEGISWREAKKIIRNSKADIIGVTFITQTRFAGFTAARMAKKLLPKSLVVVGGPHASATARDTLTHIKEVDVVVIGEGEVTMHELCLAVKNRNDYSQISGIVYRKNGEISIIPPRKMIENLDELPFPARHLLKRYGLSDKNYPKCTAVWLNKDGNFETSKVVPIVTSRGCPYRCMFCSVHTVWSKKFRQRSPKNIIDELKYVIRNYGVNTFYIVDDTFTINRKRTVEICNLIVKEKLNVRWICNTRVDALFPELLQKMKDSGCVSIIVGVESGSQRVLDEIIKKKITIVQVKKVIAWCKKIGIGIRCNFMISLPGEKYEEMLETLKLIGQIEHGILGITVILPGTDLEYEAIKRGVLPKNFTWTKRKIYPKIDPFLTGTMQYYIDDIDFADIFSIFLNYTKTQKHYPTSRFIKTAIRKSYQLKSSDEIFWLFAFYIGTFIVMMRAKLRKRRQIK